LGALLGAALGHRFDKGYGRLQQEPPPGFAPGEQERVQTAFFVATFSVMGHLAKADGRVSEDEIRLARQIMDQMSLDAEKREAGIRLFREGKAPGFPLEEVVDQFRRECHRRRNLLQMFLEIQLQAAYADGVVHPRERELLLWLATRLGFSRGEFAHLEALVRDGAHFAGEAAPRGRGALVEAYEILGVSAEASDEEVKRAYRRLMNQHHPDKLVAKGLPEEMMKLANEKVREIRNAYDLIRKRRGH
jgi:DnaJ like chaperone protein